MRLIRGPLVIVSILFTTLSLMVGEGGRVGATPRRTDEVSRPPIVKTTKVAPGLKLTRIIDKKTPRRIFVLRADLSQAISLDVALAGPQFPTRAKTSDIAAKAGAVAAVNGDFGSNSGTTTHPFADDGQLARTSAQLGWMFAVSADEQHVYLGRAPPTVTVTDTSSGQVLPVDRWNDGPPGVGEITGYTSVGGTLEPSPAYACSVHLAPAGSPSISPTDGIDQSFTVDQVGCQATAMAPGGGVVLSAPPSTDEATELLALSVGTSILLHWTLGWPDVLDAIGGVPLLVEDGRVVVDQACATSFCRANPRTGIGVTSDGTILFVVVDGRQARWSVGATLYRFAKIMKDLGAVSALNLDGGGSSTMVVKGDVVDRPSDGFERRVSSAVLILPGPEPASSG